MSSTNIRIISKLNRDVKAELEKLKIPRYLKTYLMKQIQNEQLQYKLILELQHRNKKLLHMNKELKNQIYNINVQPLSIANVMPYLQAMKKQHRTKMTINDLKKYFHITSAQAQKTIAHLIRLGIASVDKHQK